MSLYSDKYRPKATKQIVGADYAAMGLLSWLRSWNTPQRQFRAAILSGPPGIGKSVLAEVACAEAGLMNVLRLDSSRKRTKQALAEVEEAFSSRKIDAYLTGKMQKSKPGAVIVDDLDAMVTGGADRGGVPQVISFIKTSKIPVICVCNDANNRSFKTLISLCMHIRMQRPPLEAIAQRLMEIAKGENLKGVTLQLARDISRGSGCDVRQAINELQFSAHSNISALSAKSDSTGITMDRAFNPFDAVQALFGCHPRDSVKLSTRVYEADSMLGPLLIQENYLKAAKLDVETISAVADALSEGDVVEGAGRRGHVLADAKAFMSCAMPCVLAGAKIEGQLAFPGYLGRSSALTKNKKLVTDASKRLTNTICAQRQVFATEMLPLLHRLVVTPLCTTPAASACKAKPSAKKTQSASANTSPAQHVAQVMTSLHLNREDWDTVQELGMVRARTKSELVPATAKAALTREMNKLLEPKAAKGKKRAAPTAGKNKNGSVPKKQRVLSEKKEDSDKEEGSEKENEGEEKEEDYCY